MYYSLLGLLIKVFIDDINKQKNNVRDVSLLKKNYVFCNNKAINVAVYSFIKLCIHSLTNGQLKELNFLLGVDL